MRGKLRRFLTAASALFGIALLGAATVPAAAVTAQTRPCPSKGCDGADPKAVTSWASAPKVIDQFTLSSGASLKLYQGKPSWDSSETYAWAEVTLPAKPGVKAWLSDMIEPNDWTLEPDLIKHPSAFRTVSGTTAMFDDGEFVRACVNDGVQQGCTGGYGAGVNPAREVAPVVPCQDHCDEVDPDTVTSWSYGPTRDAAKRVQLAGGAWVQIVTGQAYYGTQYSWADTGLPTAGSRMWLEQYEGAGRWGNIWVSIGGDNGRRTTSGHTHAFVSLGELRACVTDGSETRCTKDDGTAAVVPTQAPCAQLPCEGVDASTVTWLENHEPRQVAAVSAYQGGKVTVYEGTPAWDPEHEYRWAEAELPPNSTKARAWLEYQDRVGAEKRLVLTPLARPEASRTTSGRTGMFVANWAGNRRIRACFDDGKEWGCDGGFPPGNIQRPDAPCAEPCTGLDPTTITDWWWSGPTEGQRVTLSGGGSVALKTGDPRWSRTGVYAWADGTVPATAGARIWIEDKGADGVYRTIAERTTSGATGMAGVPSPAVRACVTNGTSTVCTKPGS
ncbi:hypothetical protein ACIRSU_26165 [Streptomyces sp. NPDC101160]|uniref:hypothetical protein n=1 Tax=Streptomyces sp. NPDC101160 TaxID=3366118 RepID=UPI00381A04F1